MKLLIIEDDPNKLNQLDAFMRELHPDVEIATALSYNSGLQKILSGDWDAVLLDMQLPTFDKSPRESGGRQRALAGQQILRRMLKQGIQSPVIIVTQFERFGEGSDAISLSELIALLERDRFPNYIGTVYYHANLSNWKDALQGQLRKAMLRK